MLDTARPNEVNITYQKILREMNCYSFIFGKKKPLPSSLDNPRVNRRLLPSRLWRRRWGSLAGERRRQVLEETNFERLC